MTGTVSGVESARRYKGNDQWEDYIIVKVQPDDAGFVAVPFPVEMAAVFNLGKRVNITVSEVR